MTFLRLTLSALLVFGALCPMNAQMRRVNASTGQTETLSFLYGFYGGLNINYHTPQFGALPGYPSCCAEYGNNTALGAAMGASFELPFTSQLVLQARLGYSSLSGLLSRTERIGNEPVIPDGPVPIEERSAVTTEHTLDASLPMIVLEPSVGYKLFDLLMLSAGIRAGYLIQATFEQAETLLEPQGYTFLDGSTVRNTYSTDIPSANKLQLHASVGLGYELRTRSTVSLVPEVRYYLPLTSVSSVDWRVQSFQVGVNVRFGVYDPVAATVIEDTVYVRDTVIAERIGLREPVVSLRDSRQSVDSRREGDTEYRTVTVSQSYLREVPRPFNPGLQAAIVGRRPDGTVGKLDALRVEELDVIESYPLLPQVFFPEATTELAQTKQVVLDADEAKDFRLRELTRDQIDVYRNLLNIIGSRMAQNPKATITVEGHVNNSGAEQNNRELSRMRAESVRQYLTSVWGIDAQRVNIKASLLPAQPANPNTTDGRAENQRIEITTSDVAILEPVEFRDKDLIITPENIVSRPTLADKEGVRDWQHRITQNGKELARASGDGVPGNQDWNAERSDVKPSKDGALISTFTVRDANGIAATASDSLNVDYVTLQTMKARQEEGKMVERYSLIVFDFNSAQLNPSNQRLMQRVKQRIQPDSKVRITGFADRQGNPEYNRELARKRCVEAQRVLGLGDDRVTIEPIGSDRLAFDNDTPEGRSYSRTVQIEIVTPVR